MCGQPARYATVPWFWSDQYDLNLQMVGVPERWDRLVLRGAMTERRFSAFYLADGHVVGANAVNAPRDVRFARKFIEAGRPVDAAALADTNVALKNLVAS